MAAGLLFEHSCFAFFLAGYEVEREHYVNDHISMDVFGHSISKRYPAD